MVNGHNLEAGMELDGKVILDRAVSRIWEISVDYDLNTLSLTFSGLNFARPVQTCYRVRVQGLYDDWKVYTFNNSQGRVDAKGLFHLQLPALKPGKYVVEVQVSMDPNHFELRPYTWTVYVNEPWWRSTGIYLLLGLIVALLAIANVVLYNYNTRLSMMRSNKEADIMRRIRNYMSRCDELRNELLLPSAIATEEEKEDELKQNKLFFDTMLVIIPYLRAHSKGQVTNIKILTPYDEWNNGFERDKNGDIVKWLAFSSVDPVIKFNYVYQEYDQHGNWTKCVIEGVPITRILTYWE